MGLAFPVIALATVAFILSNQAFHVESEPNELQNAKFTSSASQLQPMSFEARQARRKRDARGGNRQRNTPPGHQEGNTIMSVSIPNCVEEGMVLMQGYDNYFVKCVANHVHGGFYRVVYLCPTGIRAVVDVSMCIPPPDCSVCGNSGGIDDAEMLGTGPTLAKVDSVDVGINLGSQTATVNTNGQMATQTLQENRQTQSKTVKQNTVQKKVIKTVSSKKTLSNTQSQVSSSRRSSTSSNTQSFEKARFPMQNQDASSTHTHIRRKRDTVGEHKDHISSIFNKNHEVSEIRKVTQRKKTGSDTYEKIPSVVEHEKKKDTLNIDHHEVSHHKGFSHDNTIYRTTKKQIAAGSNSLARSELSERAERSKFPPTMQETGGHPEGHNILQSDYVSNMDLSQKVKEKDGTKNKLGYAPVLDEFQYATLTGMENHQKRDSRQNSLGSTHVTDPEAHGMGVNTASEYFAESNVYNTQRENTVVIQKNYERVLSPTYHGTFGSITGLKKSLGSDDWKHQLNYRYNPELVNTVMQKNIYQNEQFGGVKPMNAPIPQTNHYTYNPNSEMPQFTSKGQVPHTYVNEDYSKASFYNPY